MTTYNENVKECEDVEAKYFYEACMRIDPDLDLAKIIGGPMQVSRIKRGETKKLDINTGKAMAEALGITVDELIEEARKLRSTAQK